MTRRFDGKVAVVTGAAQGIGTAYARALAGWPVAARLNMVVEGIIGG